MKSCSSIVIRTVGSAALAAGLLAFASPALASNNGFADWQAYYPNSDSDAAGCQLCHAASLGQLNAYGHDICLKFETLGYVPSDWSDVIEYLDGLDSDQDPNGSDNGVEIDNDAEPGWTTAANPLFVADFTQSCAMVQVDSSVPKNVPLPYDVSVSGDPVANPNGPYEAVVGDVITFDGSGSYDDVEIVQYDWVFGDGGSMVDAGPNPEYSYEEAAVYAVVLTVTDNDGNVNAAATRATISPLYLLDLDIADFSVTSKARVGKAITLQLKVKNDGDVLGQAIATVTGVQNSIEVFRLRLNVYDDIGKGTTTFDFGSYTPTVPGDITWMAAITDEAPDEDMATATTQVK